MIIVIAINNDDVHGGALHHALGEWKLKFSCSAELFTSLCSIASCWASDGATSDDGPFSAPHTRYLYVVKPTSKLRTHTGILAHSLTFLGLWFLTLNFRRPMVVVMLHEAKSPASIILPYDAFAFISEVLIQLYYFAQRVGTIGMPGTDFSNTHHIWVIRVLCFEFLSTIHPSQTNLFPTA